MPSLSQHVLHAKLRAALPNGTSFQTSGEETRPALAEIPGIGSVRVYLWTATHIESQDRDPDEYKIQLILPEQVKGARGALNLAQPYLTLLLGYSPDFGVYVAWEARRHEQFGYSKTVYVREETLEDARSSGWAVAPPRRTSAGEEVPVAFTPGNLISYISVANEANSQGLSGVDREAFFLFRSPNTTVLPIQQDDIAGHIEQQRRYILAKRLSRDAKFGPFVKAQYGYSCAICETQLEIIEGAHIIPISEEGSEDAAWNGIALCPNHHKLFDANALIVKPSLKIWVDNASIDYFRACGRAGGVETLLTPFHDNNMREPKFFRHDKTAQRRMIDALVRRASLAAIR